MAIEAVKKKYPILDESGQPSTYPTFASQVFFEDGTALEGKEFDADLLAVYPVGSIYMSTSSTSPASLFGGTWEQLKDRFLLGAGSSYAAGSEGGEAENLLTDAQLPEHTHTGIFHGGLRMGLSNGTAGSSYEFYKLGFERLSGYQGTTPYTGANGGASGEAVNNMPPYLAVNMWKRVA